MRQLRQQPHRILLLALISISWATQTQAQTPFQTPSQPTPSKMPMAMEDNKVLTYVNFSQLEGRFLGPQPTFRWDAEAWIGTDKNKLWLKSEGDVANGQMSDGDQEFLYDRPFPRMRYFDWQAGLRADLDSDPKRAWAAIGIQGLAPYFFDFEPTFYIRNSGHVAGRIEGSYNLFITQRLIAQPQLEMNLYSKDDPARGIGSGLSDVDTGLRLGYQFSRKFAPYIGYVYSSSFNNTATYAQQNGEPTHASTFAAGIWLWQ